MPKRIVDGDALWRSDKLAAVQPPAFRAEFANMLPLALANGTFECNPRLVWSQVYAYNRPDITEALVANILDEFERVKLLFRFTTADGKVWGHWVGINAKGRLPAPSRLENGYSKQGEPAPQDKLQEFLGSAGTNEVATASCQLAASYIGIGLGSGVGKGTGIGVGVGKRSGPDSNANQPSRPSSAASTLQPEPSEPNNVNHNQPLDLRARAERMLQRYPRKPGTHTEWDLYLERLEQGIRDLATNEHGGDTQVATNRVDYCLDKFIAYHRKNGTGEQYIYRPNRFFEEWVPGTKPPSEGWGDTSQTTLTADEAGVTVSSTARCCHGVDVSLSCKDCDADDDDL